MNPSELTRQRTKAHEVREVLRDGAWHSNAELSRVALRFGGRLLEIRNGHDGGEPWLIESRRLADGLWQYRYTGPNPSPLPEQEPGLSWKTRALHAEERVRELEQERKRFAQGSLFGGAA